MRFPRHVGPDLLAVYGTLRRGFRNYPLVASGADWLGPGRMPGRLVHISGPTRRYAYPGYVPGEDGTVVVEVLRILDPLLWPGLDALERCLPDDPASSEYLRIQVHALLDSGTPLTCWTYAYNRFDQPWPTIPSGDWARLVVPDVTGP